MIKNNFKINSFLLILFFAMLFIGVFTINTSVKAADTIIVYDANINTELFCCMSNKSEIGYYYYQRIEPDLTNTSKINFVEVPTIIDTQDVWIEIFDYTTSSKIYDGSQDKKTATSDRTRFDFNEISLTPDHIYEIRLHPLTTNIGFTRNEPNGSVMFGSEGLVYSSSEAALAITIGYDTPPSNDYLLIYDGGYYTDPDNELANIEDIYRFIHPPYVSGKTYSNTPFKFAYNYCDYLNNEYVSKGLCVGDNSNCPDFTITQHYEPKTGSNVYPDYDIIKSQVFVDFDSCSGIYEFYPDDIPLKDGKTFISLYDDNNLAQVAISNEVNYQVLSLSHLESGDNFIRLNGDYHYTRKFKFSYDDADETFSIPVVWDFCGLDWYNEETGFEVCVSGPDRHCVVADTCSGFGYIEHPMPDSGQILNKTLLVLEPLPSVNSPYIQNNYWFTIEKEVLPLDNLSATDFCNETTENFVSYGFCWMSNQLFNPIFNTIKTIPSHIFPINVFNVFVDTWEDSADKSLSSDFTFLFSSVNSSGEVVIYLPNQFFIADDDFVIFSKNWFKGDSVLSNFFSGFKKITPYLFFGAYLIFVYSLLRKVKNNNLD